MQEWVCGSRESLYCIPLPALSSTIMTRFFDGTTYGHENMIVMITCMYRMKRTGRSSVYLVDTGAKPGHAMLPDMGFYHPPSGEAPEKEKGNTTPPRSVGHKNWKTKEIYPPLARWDTKYGKQNTSPVSGLLVDVISGLYVY